MYLGNAENLETQKKREEATNWGFLFFLKNIGRLDYKNEKFYSFIYLVVSLLGT